MQELRKQTKKTTQKQNNRKSHKLAPPAKQLSIGTALGRKHQKNAPKTQPFVFNTQKTIHIHQAMQKSAFYRMQRVNLNAQVRKMFVLPIRWVFRVWKA